jgi:hypothetical protein
MVKALEGVNGGVATGVNAITADEHLVSRLKATYLGLYRGGEGEKREKIAAA